MSLGIGFLVSFDRAILSNIKSVSMMMTSSRLIKLFVVLFSITAGGLVVWQLSRNLSGENAVGSADPNVDEKTEVMPIGPKSVGGALGVTEHFEPEPPKRPLLSGSKSPVILPTEAVTIPGVPPAPSDDHSEGGEDPFAE